MTLNGSNEWENTDHLTLAGEMVGIGSPLMGRVATHTDEWCLPVSTLSTYLTVPLQCIWAAILTDKLHNGSINELRPRQRTQTEQ